MRLGEKRRICIRGSRAKRRKISVGLLVCLCVMAVFVCALYIMKIMQPLMVAQAQNRTKVLAEQAVFRAVSQIFEDKNYADFINLSRLEDGTISAVNSDMAEMNRLNAETAMAIQKEIDSITETKIQIPFGSVSGCAFLSGIGPLLPVQLMPYGHTQVEFSSKLTEAGINQTHFEMSLVATCYFNLVMPGYDVSSEIKTELPVVQTIIVGKIPDNYVNIDQLGEGYESDVLDIIG